MNLFLIKNGRKNFVQRKNMYNANGYTENLSDCGGKFYRFIVRNISKEPESKKVYDDTLTAEFEKIEMFCSIKMEVEGINDTENN